MTTTVAAKVRTTSREEIAANVRGWMARRKVEQSAIADLLGKSKVSVSGRVNGTIHFRIDELQLVAAHLNITLDQLLENDDSTPTT